MEKILPYVLGMLFMSLNVLTWAIRYGYIEADWTIVACFAANVVVLAASWVCAAQKQKHSSDAHDKEVM